MMTSKNLQGVSQAQWAWAIGLIGVLSFCVPAAVARAQSDAIPTRTHLSGRVIDEHGRPIEGAIVDLGGLKPPKGAGDQLWLVATDSRGRFYFDSAQVDGYIRV